LGGTVVQTADGVVERMDRLDEDGASAFILACLPSVFSGVQADYALITLAAFNCTIGSGSNAGQIADASGNSYDTIYDCEANG
jgi:hypothetical protein